MSSPLLNLPAIVGSQWWVVCSFVRLVPIRSTRMGHDRMASTQATPVGGETVPWRMKVLGFETTDIHMKQFTHNIHLPCSQCPGRGSYISSILYIYKHICIYIHTYIYACTVKLLQQSHRNIEIGMKTYETYDNQLNGRGWKTILLMNCNLNIYMLSVTAVETGSWLCYWSYFTLHHASICIMITLWLYKELCIHSYN